MATHLIVPIALISLLAVVTTGEAVDVPPLRHKMALTVAAREMQRAGYFSFVMLIKMVQDKLPSNATFLVPSDRMLSRVVVPQDEVMKFLLRHSIPSLLLFDDLQHLPSGTLLPTYQPGFMIKVSNCGRKRFYLNSAQLVLPNLCTTGLSFRCHGIMGAMQVSSPEIDAPVNCSAHAPPLADEPAEPSPAPVFPAPSPPAPCKDTACSPSPAPPDQIPTKSSSSMINLSMPYATIVLIPFLVSLMVNHLL